MKSIIYALLLVSTPVFAEDQCAPNCDQKLQIKEEVISICEEVLSQCNDKVKELDKHINILDQKITEQEDFIKKDEKYINDLEAYAKRNDTNSWWNRHKMLIGFVGGILLTTGAGIGIMQITK